jgi:hypothetical protein
MVIQQSPHQVFIDFAPCVDKPGVGRRALTDTAGVFDLNFVGLVPTVIEPSDLGQIRERIRPDDFRLGNKTLVKSGSKGIGETCPLSAIW